MSSRSAPGRRPTCSGSPPAWSGTRSTSSRRRSWRTRNLGASLSPTSSTSPPSPGKAPALVQADVGIAIGAGTDVAMESADIVLVRNNPRDVVRLIRLSQLTSRKMRQNLIWATGYNAFALPLAAGVGVPVGIVLRPEWGALFMAASSIIVVTNALLMRRQAV